MDGAEHTGDEHWVVAAVENCVCFPAGGQQAPQVALHGHADACGTDGRDRGDVEEGGLGGGRDCGGRHEHNIAIGRHAHEQNGLLDAWEHGEDVGTSHDVGVPADEQIPAG